jgi:hypothetical protein
MNNGEIELTQTISQNSVHNILALTEDLVKTKLMTIENLIESTKVFLTTWLLIIFWDNCTTPYVPFYQCCFNLYGHVADQCWRPFVRLKHVLNGIFNHVLNVHHWLLLLMNSYVVRNVWNARASFLGILIFGHLYDTHTSCLMM